MTSVATTVWDIIEALADPGELPDSRDFGGSAFMPQIDSFFAAEELHPGRCVEIASDGMSVQQCQSTGSTCRPVGIVVRRPRPSLCGFGYSLGDMVPVLTRGLIFAAWSGIVQPTRGPVGMIGTLNVYHSSTLATLRGVFTDSVLSTVAGAEVSAAGLRCMPAGVQRARIAILLNVGGF